MSFAFYNLLKHPEAYRKAQQEVDEAVGDGPITVEHTSKLQYIQAVSVIKKGTMIGLSELLLIRNLGSAGDVAINPHNPKHQRHANQRRDHRWEVCSDHERHTHRPDV